MYIYIYVYVCMYVWRCVCVRASLTGITSAFYCFAHLVKHASWYWRKAHQCVTDGFPVCWRLTNDGNVLQQPTKLGFRPSRESSLTGSVPIALSQSVTDNNGVMMTYLDWINDGWAAWPLANDKPAKLLTRPSLILTINLRVHKISLYVETPCFLVKRFVKHLSHSN